MILKAVFTAIGLGSFVWILHGYGFERVATDILSLGWWAIPLALSFLPVAFLYGLAWMLVTPALPFSTAFSFLRYSVISVAWNNLSPFVKMLGEPVRVMLLEDRIGRKAAVESAVLYNLVHILGTLVAFITGAALLLFLYPVTETIRFAFLGVIGITTALLLMVYFLPHAGKILGRSRNRGFTAKLRFWLRWAFAKMRMFSRRYPARFWTAVGLEVIVRFVEGVTFYVAFLALGEHVGAVEAALLDVGRALADNVFFFIPYQVGSREAGLRLLSDEVMRLGPVSIVSAALFYRLMEIFWMGAGYMLWMRASSSRRSET